MTDGMLLENGAEDDIAKTMLDDVGQSCWKCIQQY